MKTPDTPVKLIVGLGNPGPDYANTRHNAGQDFVTALSQKYSEPLTPSPKFFGFSGRIIVAGKDLRLLIPTTYMNRSGQAVAAIAQFYKIDPESILVVHDELDLEPGVTRLKIGGGHGGHNGLRDIISSLGNNKNFGRLRMCRRPEKNRQRDRTRTDFYSRTLPRQLGKSHARTSQPQHTGEFLSYGI